MEQNDKVKNLIEKAPISKTIAVLVIPALLGSIVAQINFILDSFFLSRVTYAGPHGTTILLAAVAAAFPISLLITAFANLFGIGGSLFGAKALGENNKKKARSIFSGTVIAGLVLDIILIIILLLFINPLLTTLGAKDPTTLMYARQYAAVAIIGSPTIILTFIFVMFSRSEGKATLVLISIILQTVLNIVLNYIFIMPLEMGAFGASLATVISQFAQFLITGYWLFSKKSEFQFTIRFREYFAKTDLWQVIKLGFPATLTIGLLTVSSAILQFQAGMYSNPELVAAIGVLIKFFTVFTMLIQAAASGIQSVFAFSYGSKNKDRFISVTTAYLKVSTITSVIVGVVLLIFPNIFANFLALTGNAAEYVKIGTYGIGIMLLFMSSSFLIQVLFQSLDRAESSMMIVLIRQLLVFLVLTIVFNRAFGINGLLVSQQIGIALGSILTILIYYKPLKNTINQKFKKEA